MNILCYTKYSAAGASSRLRFYGMEKHLKMLNISLMFCPLLCDSYVKNLQLGKKSTLLLLCAYIRRFLFLLLPHRNIDVIWIEKELFPWLPFWIETLLLPKRLPIIVDYDDAVFHLYDQSNRFVIRKALGEKHMLLNQAISAVTPGNQYLADYCKHWGVPKVDIIQTVIDLDRYKFAPRKANLVGPVRVVWIGQRSTSHFLQIIEPVIRKLTSEGLIRLVVIGGLGARFDFPFESVSWSADTEVALISNCDIGVMPLIDGPFERGKCGYKLIQYMACGLPVVASPVGVNCQIVEPNINGFLAFDLSEWESALRALAGSAELRTRLGTAGRSKVEVEYSVQAIAPRLAKLFQEIISDFKPRGSSKN